ncbi:hypothetical protein AB0465_40500 [Streptomyces griseoviridis]|uniref:Uncharacterized protein n=1 Tax=Streptomyces hintoniae TaxID=3075521 RepID=A0ABU2UER2_9ACTN|nr:hypothetical protein [Streptomyces sp. DSM 41014]MDT0471738.1 hypothetical protein [Streptomyces sp. DSM 41014]
MPVRPCACGIGLPGRLVALLAAHVWHRKELEQQFTAEGGC